MYMGRTGTHPEQQLHF